MKRICLVLYTTLEKNAFVIALACTFLLSITTEVYYFQHNLITGYNDAASHLNMARRITDSLNPGLVQLGAVWLPLIHLLEAPFTMNDFLWRSGLAGSIVSMICFFISSIAVFKIVQFLMDDKIAAFLAVLVFITNANLLYMQTAPLFEVLLIATLLWAVYFLLRWQYVQTIPYLLAGALFVMFATMSRYDGWFFFLVAILVVFFVAFKKRGYHSAEGVTVMFSALAGLGIVLWFLYNKIIFGTFTYFLNGAFSSRAQQVIEEKAGLLPAHGHIVLAIVTYIVAIMRNEGIIIVILALIATCYVFMHRKLEMPIKITTILLWSPLLFNILSLYNGQSIIWIPGIPPYQHSYYNIRYGLLVLPACVVMIGIFASRVKWAQVFILLAILVQFGLFYYDTTAHTFSMTTPVTLAEANSSSAAAITQTVTWMDIHCGGGKYTLMSAAAHDPIMFKSGIDEKYIISEGDGKYWTDSMKKPSTYASCVIYDTGPLDRIHIEIKNYKDLHKNFSLVENYSGILVYERIY